MKRIFSVIFLAGMLIGAFAAPAAAGSDSPALSRIVESGKLRVGTSGSQPPFSVVAKSGEIIGYEIDIARLLADAMQVELVLVQKPFGELLSALEKGDVDMVMSGMTMTPERNLKAAFVGPYKVSGKSILTTSATLAAIKEAGELDQAKLKLAALKGSTSQSFVERHISKAQLTAVDTYDTAVAALLDGTIDAMVADFPICALTALRHPDKGLATLTKPLTIEPIGVAIAPGDSLLLNMVENYLGALEVLDVLGALEEKWFADGTWLIHLP